MKFKQILLIILLLKGVVGYSQTKKIEKVYYPNGNLKLEAELILNKPYGYVKLFDETGRLRDLTYYRSGLNLNSGDSIVVKYGLHKTFDENGSILLNGEFKDDKKNGEWRSYYSSGKLKDKVNFIEGNQSGNYISYYENGTKKSEGSYINGLKMNKWVDYHPNGNIKKEYSYKKSFNSSVIITGLIKIYDENEILIKTEKNVGRSDYELKGYYKSGKEAFLYTPNRNFGELVEYYENRKEKKTRIFTEKNKKHGRWKHYNENEILMAESHYHHGDKIGNWKGYFSNGNLKYEYNYKSDNLDGLWSYYYEDGKLFTTREYVEGKLINVIKLLNSNGDKLDFGSIKNGNGTIKTYDKFGKLKLESIVKDGIIKEQLRKN